MQWIKNICRLCGQVEEIPYHIFDSDNNLEEKIKKCLNLEVCKEDFKPKQLCRPCGNKLDDFCNFIDLCYATNLKFESIYYTDPWHENNDRILYEPVNIPKQSVIVTNRQSHDHSTQFYHPTNNGDTIGILPSYTISQSENISDNILDFSVNYNNIQPNDIQNCFSECSTFDKPENITSVEQNKYTQNEKAINSCLVNENDPSDLLDSVDNGSTPVEDRVGPCRILKNVLVSVDTIRKSLDTKNLPEMRSSDLKTKKSYLCPHCDKVFRRRSNLNAHISVHTKIRPYKCSSCSKTFAVKCHLTQHRKTHLDIFVCQFCHKKFDVPSKLSRHMQTHTKNRPFVCTFPDCNKSFSDKNNLKQHTLIHSTEKSFSCVICMKQFKTRKNLKAHVSNHVNIGKFQCKFCQKVFKHKHNLRTHLIKHNKGEIKIS